jgi:hypothetical protein
MHKPNKILSSPKFEISSRGIRKSSHEIVVSAKDGRSRSRGRSRLYELDPSRLGCSTVGG